LRKRNAVVARNTATTSTTHATDRITAVVDYYVRGASVRLSGSTGAWFTMSKAALQAAESNGGCSSGVERLTVAQEVAGSKPVTRPI
jgi:hypothetical protein